MAGRYDVIIPGGGNAGFGVSQIAHEAGKTIAFVEHRIVGAHMVGHRGEDLIHLFALAMRHGISASALKDGVFAFPTFAADVKSLY